MEESGGVESEEEWACRAKCRTRLSSEELLRKNKSAPPRGSQGEHWAVNQEWSEVAQSCPTLRPVDCSPPGSSVHGILQARILEWVAISFSRGSSQPRDRSWVTHIAGRRFNLCTTREAKAWWAQRVWRLYRMTSKAFLSTMVIWVRGYSSYPKYYWSDTWTTGFGGAGFGEQGVFLWTSLWVSGLSVPSNLLHILFQ